MICIIEYMTIKNHIQTLKDPDKRVKVITFFTMLYNFFWAIGKILFGVFMQTYIYCISGAYTLLLGFSKKIFVSNHNVDKEIDIETKSLIIGILLTISGIAFGIYMGGLYIWQHDYDYGLIWSIAIAACSFVELGIAIYNLLKVRKKDDILLFSLRCCNIASSLFAIVLTQVALLSATGTENTYMYNATTGIIASVLVICVGFIVIGKSAFLQKKKASENIQQKTNKKLEENSEKTRENNKFLKKKIKTKKNN